MASALALGLLLATSTQAAQVFIDEAFDGDTVPDGWIFTGKDGASHTDPNSGTDKGDDDWFGDGDFVRLTSQSPGSQRTTAIYGGDTFTTRSDFTISAEVRITSSGGTIGADGMSFFWLDASSLDLVNHDLSHYQGGIGEWQGTPRGTDFGAKTPGSHGSHFGAYNSSNGFVGGATGESLRGYSFEFDHYRNAQMEQQEYNHMVRLDDWAHMDNMAVDFSGTNDHYYEDVGWVSFELAYSAAEQTFTYSYIDSLGALHSIVLEPLAEEWREFDLAYFGISAGTGGQVADHDVRNLMITAAHGPGTHCCLRFYP